MFWPKLQKRGTLVPVIPTLRRKSNKYEEEEEEEEEKEENIPARRRACGELHALGKTCAFDAFTGLCEGASSRLRREAMTAHRVRLRLGVPFTTMRGGRDVVKTGHLIELRHFSEKMTSVETNLNFILLRLLKM